MIIKEDRLLRHMKYGHANLRLLSKLQKT